MADLEIAQSLLPDQVAHLELKGFLDAHTFEKLDTAIAQLLAKGVSRLVVGLRDVAYIGSAGAGVFIGAVGKARERQGDIVLLSPSQNVREVFDLLGLSQIFHIVDTLEGAQTFFRK